MFAPASRWRFQNAQADPDSRDSVRDGNALLREPNPGERRHLTNRKRTVKDNCGSSARHEHWGARENIETQTTPLGCIPFSATATSAGDVDPDPPDPFDSIRTLIKLPLYGSSG